MGSSLAGLPWESLQQIFDAASGFASVQLRACSFTVVALFGAVVRTSLQADDPNLTVDFIEDDIVVLKLRSLVLAESEFESF